MVVADIRDILLKRNSPKRYAALMARGAIQQPQTVHSDEAQLEQVNDMEQHMDDQGDDGDFDLSRLLTADPCIYNAKIVQEACIPSANGHFSARAIARFYSSLIDTVDGVALFNEETLQGATEVGFSTGHAAMLAHTRVLQLQTEEKMGMREEPMRWGLGFQKYTYVGVPSWHNAPPDLLCAGDKPWITRQ
jgi:hypothetical protein